ncbi:hypothetical protein KY285_006457 [Solanum tuberosum]|nr:hypothetical protein KY284_005689 [Solanum tuberosum]KAH0753309.1 hypothetical protein KY285_006457 [Solanum tuberosum]
MAATTLYQSVGTLQSCRNNGNSGLFPDYGHVSFRSVSKVSRLRLLMKLQYHQVPPPANKKTNVPLTTKGVEAAVEAGKRISNITYRHDLYFYFDSCSNDCHACMTAVPQ